MTRATVDGNEAAASVAYRLNEVCCIYPITPSSPMAEFADEWSSQKRPNLWGGVPAVVEMQHEGRGDEGRPGQSRKKNHSPSVERLVYWLWKQVLLRPWLYRWALWFGRWFAGGTCTALPRSGIAGVATPPALQSPDTPMESCG